MIFSILRYIELADLPDEITCSNDDYTTAFYIVEKIKEHLVIVYEKMPKSKNTEFTDEQKKAFIDALPLEFSRKDAKSIGTKLGIAERTIDRILRNSEFIAKANFNCYQKIV